MNDKHADFFIHCIIAIIFFCLGLGFMPSSYHINHFLLLYILTLASWGVTASFIYFGISNWKLYSKLEKLN